MYDYQVEGLSLVLRKKHNIDNLPLRGKFRARIWLGFKISAINCKRYIKAKQIASKKRYIYHRENNITEFF